ncbi:MAG: adenosylcobinamide-GDP ribazoletransferase [Chloroherpetonaceae bacterium]
MSQMKTEFNIFLSAVMFLTRLPVSRFVEYNPDHLSKSTLYFPLVGALVGSVGALALFLASLKCSPILSVLASMATTILLTGAFHEDGLADSADGFGGGYTKERILEIMKDSRIGTYGAIALWLFLTAKLLLLTEIFKQEHSLALSTLVVAHMLGRYSSMPLIFTLEYARSESTSSKPFAQKASLKRLVVASLYTMLLCIWLLEWDAIIALGISGLIAFWARHFFVKQIGGITGDALGAANQLVELGVYAGIYIAISATE